MRSARTTALFAAGALVALLAGCTTSNPPQPSASPNDSAALLATVLAELGPFPPSTPLSADEQEAALVAADDSYWAQVLAVHPDAERPAVDRVKAIQSSEYASIQKECMRSEGQVVPETSGEAFGWEFNITLAGDLAWYTCAVRYPAAPRPPLTPAQLGYFYDYLTQFTAPCLDALGSKADTPPSRNDFVTKWPNQRWFPAPTNVQPADPEFSAAAKLCPTRAPGMDD